MQNIFLEKAIPAKKNALNALVGGLNDMAQGGLQNYQKSQENEKQSKALQSLGLSPEVAAAAIGNPKILEALIGGKIDQHGELAKQQTQMKQNEDLIRAIEKQRNMEPGSLRDFVSNPSLANQVTKPQKTEGGITAQPVPPEIAKNIKTIIDKNPKATADEIALKMDEEGIPPIYSNRYLETRRRNEEQGTKNAEEKVRALRQETLPIRKQIADKAMAAEQGIQNKEQLLEIIDRGNLNDPTYAAVASALPLNLGKRLLSNDTTEYKAGLVEEFGDLRNIFQGQTRIKEIELLEEKIADIYLTDEQKKAVLKSRIQALKADAILADVAAEMENEPYGILQFEKELQKRAKPRLEGLFNQILDEHKAIIKNAENKKKVPLDINDPEDKKIAEAILKEAGGNRNKARELAKKKGYTF